MFNVGVSKKRMMRISTIVHDELQLRRLVSIQKKPVAFNTSYF